MSALAARHLRRAGAAHVLVANRSAERAAELAAEVDGEARLWEELDDLLVSADVVITSTGSREPVLTKKQLKKVTRKRRYRSLLIVDIAVPRDAEPEIADCDGVYLFDIDDLERVVAETLKQRSREAETGAEIVESEAVAFESWARSQLVVPTIRNLREHFINVASAEAERAAVEIARAEDPEVREKLARKLADRIAKKLLHAPMLALKAGDADIDAMARLTRTLFDLERDDDNEAEPEPARAAAPVAAHPGEKK
jgi:glutamyl-tRNA reductase